VDESSWPSQYELVQKGLLTAVLALSLAVPGTAFAHGTHYEGYVSVVERIVPMHPGLLVDVVGRNERIAVRNLTRSNVVFFDANGERIETIAAGDAGTWHEPRIHEPGPPPKQSGLIRRWQLRGEADGRPFIVKGFLGYAVPPAQAASSGDNWTSPGRLAALTGLGVVVLAALALPLVVRWKGEG
jgi:hypothetical protein